MNSREEILRTIRRQLPQLKPLPELTGDWIEYPDPLRQFFDVMESVGGECHQICNVAEIPPLLSAYTALGKRVVSAIPGLWEPRLDLASIADPHALHDVELAVLPGQLAVAENSAIWVEAPTIAQRILYFLCQHLALVVPAENIVHNLYQAYGRIDPGRTPYSGFIAGPSKTADIEQSLVKGAHGSRTITVFFLASPTP